ncbi:MAG: protein kinase [Acidobacteria bacterium]|nr:protein kinase [Acidobacteriota bacterium]
MSLMEVQRLQKIEEIFHAALEVESGQRAALLTDRCGTDDSLRREVESLLDHESALSDFLDTTPESFIAEAFTESDAAALLIGKKIGHYRVRELLGKGGMGEVFLAEDTSLKRRVALKCLPPEFVENKDRMTRFINEARAASGLNHPNIITIHEINQFDGIHFIATEYIEGKNLSEFTKGERLSVRKALEIAIQIASGLGEAHSAGIIHRDIKPDNIMIRKNGLIKILDFGIAKLVEGQINVSEANSASAELPGEIRDQFLTNPGSIIGTARYMSPEQARGKEIDSRSDIFSFGVLFYELLAGNTPFPGETPLEILGAIMQTAPKPLESTDIPCEIRDIVGKCLAKDPDERYQTTDDLLSDLTKAKEKLATDTQRLRAFATGETVLNTTDARVAEIGPSRPRGFGIARLNRNFVRLVPFVVLLLLVSAIGFWSYRYFSAAKQIKSVAVMPIVNESESKDADYLSDGMTENLISNLSNIPQLSIKARSTVFTYKNRSVSAKTIGQELNVDAVLIGNLIQRGETLRVNLELVDAETQDVLWSENYERDIDYLVSLESEIASDVSENLRLKLTNAELKQVAKSYTTNSEAQRMYLKGRFHWNRRTERDFESAVRYFEQAVEIDPNYALAYTGLADTYALMPLYGNFRPNDYIPLAKRAALKAIELDPQLAEPHASLGYITNTYDYDWEGAAREYRIAIRLNPNYATAHQWYAEHLAFKGKNDEALNEISLALELDPFSVVINRMKGNILGFAKRHDEAIAQLKKTIELFPENALVRFNLGDVYAAQRAYREAIEQYLIALKLDGRDPADVQRFESAYRKLGWEGFWNEYLRSLLAGRNSAAASGQSEYFNSENIAFVFAATKNKEQALEYLHKAFEERDPTLISIKVSGVYDFLEDDPRYQELLRSIGL